jgi:hypothetical protein
MKRIKSILTVTVVVATMMVSSAVPAIAQDSFPPCGWYYTQGESGPYRSHGVVLYYENWYGWHQWCESPVRGWYVID